MSGPIIVKRLDEPVELMKWLEENDIKIEIHEQYNEGKRVFYIENIDFERLENDLLVDEIDFLINGDSPNDVLEKFAKEISGKFISDELRLPIFKHTPLVWLSRDYQE